MDAKMLMNINVGDVVEFGTYPQTADGDDKTPIEWYVISVDGDNIMLLSKYILDFRCFHEKQYTTWAECDLRKWLASEFYNAAFSEKEKAMITLNTCTGNGSEITRSRFGGKEVEKVAEASKDTEDYVFLLSYGEAYMLSKELGRRSHAAGIGTEYAKSKGLFSHEENGFSSWWLRTRSDDLYRGQFQTMYMAASEGETSFPYSDETVYVDNVGVIAVNGHMNNYKYGVRPAIVINGGISDVLCSGPSPLTQNLNEPSN